MKKKLMACAALLLPTLALTGCGSQFGDKMVRAGMNTLMGMGTVFVVLILISIIIFLLKYVPKMFEKKKAEPEAAKQEKPAAKAVAKQEVPVSDNTQIIAVITAAIAAQMEAETGVCVPADGLVIRSIKKRTFN